MDVLLTIPLPGTVGVVVEIGLGAQREHLPFWQRSRFWLRTDVWAGIAPDGGIFRGQKRLRLCAAAGWAVSVWSFLALCRCWVMGMASFLTTPGYGEAKNGNEAANRGFPWSVLTLVPES